MVQRSERGVGHLRYAASSIFYHLFLHGYSTPWYVLPRCCFCSYAESECYLPAMLALPLGNLSALLPTFL